MYKTIFQLAIILVFGNFVSDDDPGKNRSDISLVRIKARFGILGMHLTQVKNWNRQVQVLKSTGSGIPVRRYRFQILSIADFEYWDFENRGFWALQILKIADFEYCRVWVLRKISLFMPREENLCGREVTPI